MLAYLLDAVSSPQLERPGVPATVVQSFSPRVK